MKLLPSDNAYFYCQKNGILVGQVVIHVDDFFISGTGDFLELFLNIVKSSLKVSKIEYGSFRFTGVDIRQDEKKIVVSMNAYADSLKPVADFRKDKNEALLNELELQVYRKYTGKLSWLAENCRPDLAFLVNNLSRKSHAATLSDLKFVNKVLKKVRERESEIVYSRVGKKEDLVIKVMSDASYMKVKDSISGILVVLANKMNQVAVPLYWKSKKIAKMTTSTKDAETHALFKGVTDAVYVASTIETLLFGDVQHRLVVDSFIDSKPLLESLASTKVVENKFLVSEINALKLLLEDGHVRSYTWVATDDQLADVFTKDMLEPVAFRNLFLRIRCSFMKFQFNPRAILKIHDKDTVDESREIKLENCS